jgi:hypothetical protein
MSPDSSDLQTQFPRYGPARARVRWQHPHVTTPVASRVTSLHVFCAVLVAAIVARPLLVDALRGRRERSGGHSLPGSRR